MALRNYGRELLKLVHGYDPLETRGRKQKKKLPPSFRHDVAIVNKKNPKLKSREAIAEKLLQQPQYQGIGRRKIERGVDDVVAIYTRAWTEILKEHEPERLAKTTKRELRGKAFEVMRNQLRPK